MSTECEPATQGDDGDEETGSAQVPVFHRREVFVRHVCDVVYGMVFGYSTGQGENNQLRIAGYSAIKYELKVLKLLA
jgi:hypothetical protein